MKSAGISTRLVALVYEFFLLAGVWLTLVLFPHAAAAAALGHALPGWVIWLHSYVLLGALYCWLWSRGRQTLAMRTWRLHLQTEDGRPLAIPHAAMRYFWAWPSIGLAGIGLLWAFLDGEGRFLHDRLARTRLLRGASESSGAAD